MNLEKPSPTLDSAYLRYVRSQSCLICSNRNIDADHLLARGRGSASQNDYAAIPFCREHHAERHQVGNEKFEAKYRINLWREAWLLLTRWLAKTDRHEFSMDARGDCRECGQRINDSTHVKF